MGPADYKVGDQVLFGRGSGEQTLGEIVKKNPTKAKVKQLEQRGTQKSHPIGTIWTVPYNLLKKADGSAPSGPIMDPADQMIKYDKFMDLYKIHILEAICDVYIRLSPENLSCDGEAPRHYVQARYKELNNALTGLFKAFGRPVSETAAFDWLQQHKSEKATV